MLLSLLTFQKVSLAEIISDKLSFILIALALFLLSIFDIAQLKFELSCPSLRLHVNRGLHLLERTTQ